MTTAEEPQPDSGAEPRNPEKTVDIPLQDIVLSNSWALQAILEYLDEENPGAKDRVWQKYLAMKSLIESKGAGDEPS